MKTPKNFITTKLGRRSRVNLLTLAAMIAVPLITAKAADIHWVGPTASYTNALDWDSNSVPTSADNAINANGLANVLQINSGNPDWTVNDISAGGAANAGGAIVQDGPTLTVNGWMHIADGLNSVGIYTLNSGILNVPNGQLFFCEAPGANGTLNINGGTLNKSGDTFRIADGGWNGSGARTGVVNQVAGTVNCASEIWMGQTSPGVGLYNLSGSGIINLHNWLAVGRNGGTGVFTMTGGSFNHNDAANGGANFIIGVDNGTYGEFDQSGGTLTTTREYWVGQSGGATGVNNISGTASVNVDNWFAIARQGGSGVVNMTGGSITKTGGGDFLIGTGGTGYLNQTGGVLSVNSTLRVGDGSQGYYNMASGTVNVGGDIWVGQGGGANGVLNFTGGAITNHNWLAVGRENAIGVLNINGGTYVRSGAGGGPNGPNVSICHGSGSGTVNVISGLIDVSAGDTWIGEDTGTGTWNQNGGTSILSLIQICHLASATGYLNVNGGNLTATEITTGNSGAVSYLNFNGGTLKPAGNNANFLHDITIAQVQSGGAIFDSQGYDITVTQSLPSNGGDASGGLTKNGAGTLTLSGANTYTGPTVVNAGKLAIDTATALGAGNYTVANGAELDVTVQSHNAQVSMANLTLGTSTASTLSLNLGGFGNPASISAPLNASGTLTKNGVTTINIADTLPQPGQFPLISFATSAGSGSFVLGTLPLGVGAYLSNNVSSVDLVITNVNIPRWEGLAGGNWDIQVTTNWINVGTDLPTFYGDGNPVLFNDLAIGTTTVNLGTTVSPVSVTFNNNTAVYSIIGTGKISGATGISKQGTGTANILNTGGNNFTGPVVISGGVLAVTNLANGGAPSPLGASSSSPTNLVIGAGTLEFSGAPVAVNRGFTLVAAGATIDAESSFTLGGPVVAGSTAGFVKTGPAQLALTATGNNQLGNNSNPGTQVQQGSLLLDGSAGSQVNHNFNEMWVGCTTTSGGALILTNTTLNVDNWIGLGRINGSINNTSSITLYNSALTCGNLSLGWDNGQPNLSSQFITLNGNSTFTNNGAVNLAEGPNASMTFRVNGSSVFWVQNPFYICLANNTTGSLIVANSGKIVQANGWFDIGQGNNCVASVLVKDNATLSLDGDCNLADTAGGANGTLTAQDNATVQANNLFVGKSSSSVCTVNIAGSATAHFGNFMRLADGANSTGNVNISGGSLTMGQYINMAAASGSTANVTMSGGSLTGGNDMTVGDQATATVTMNGGVLTVPNTLYVSRGGAAANGTVNLNAGGTIVCGNVNNGWAFNQGTNSPTFNLNAFNFNGGTLKSYDINGSYIFPNVNTVVQAGGAIIDDNSYTVEFGAALVNGGGGGGLTKLGSGTLRFNATNTYTGTTLISTGTLCGFGTIAGPVKVASGATLLPGTTTAIGTLTINNSLTLSNSSKTLMKLSLDGGTNNDAVSGLSSVSYGGSLVVTNVGASSLVYGAQFQLFTAGSHVGNFANAASVAILPAGTGSFDPNTGKLTITSTGVLIFNPVTKSGGNLILTGSGGTPGAGYTWLSTTNLTIPVGSWITNTTGTFSGTGTFSNAFPIVTTEAARFFRLKTP